MRTQHIGEKNLNRVYHIALLFDKFAQYAYYTQLRRKNQPFALQPEIKFSAKHRKDQHKRGNDQQNSHDADCDTGSVPFGFSGITG
jgi:hypothetical protein